MYWLKDMFTGLIEAVGELVERKPTSGGVRLRIATSLAGGSRRATVSP